MPVFTGRNKARFNLKGTAGGNTGADIMQVIGAEGNVSVDSVYPQNGSVAVEGVAILLFCILHVMMPSGIFNEGLYTVSSGNGYVRCKCGRCDNS